MPSGDNVVKEENQMISISKKLQSTKASELPTEAAFLWLNGIDHTYYQWKGWCRLMQSRSLDSNLVKCGRCSDIDHTAILLAEKLEEALAIADREDEIKVNGGLEGYPADQIDWHLLAYKFIKLHSGLARDSHESRLARLTNVAFRTGHQFVPGDPWRDSASYQDDYGIRYPVAFSDAAWKEFVAVPKTDAAEEMERRVSILLWLLKRLVTQSLISTLDIQLMPCVQDIYAAWKQRQLLARCEFDRKGEPVITLRLPTED